MYEKATLADLAIVTGILLAVVAAISFGLDQIAKTDLYIFIGAGIGLLIAGFVLDKISEKRKKMVDIESMRPKLSAYIEDAERLMQSGAKALDAGKTQKALNIYLSAHSTLELAEQVAREADDSHRLEMILKDLTVARTGIGKAKVGKASDMSATAEQLYLQGKYDRALDICKESQEILVETSDFLNVDNEIRNIEENILNCRKRIGEKEMNALTLEVIERKGYYQEYFEKGLLFDAREMLNIMEVKIQRASTIAEEFGFATTMREINRELIYIREGKTQVEKAILERLKSRDVSKKGITTLVDMIDPTLRKVAVDVINEIKVVSGYDFRKGAVRVQFVVKNNRSMVISKVTLKVLRDERLLNLIRVIPDYEVRFNEVVLGTIQPDEKKTVNFYFDPKVCGEMTMDSTLTYLDPSGNYETIIPERKSIEIPEPKIGKAENVNSNYLTILMDQARAQGVRTFHVPSDLDLPMAFSIVHQVVAATGLNQVWSGGARELSAGYHGICDGDECGLRIDCKDRIFDISAAGGSKEGITYLLTSISGVLRDRLEKEGHRGVNIALTIKDSILYKSNIGVEDGTDAWSGEDIQQPGALQKTAEVWDTPESDRVEIIEDGDGEPKKQGTTAPNY